MNSLSNKTVSPVSCDTGTPDFSWSLKNSSIYNLDCVTNAQDTVNSQIEANANIIANSEETPPAEIIYEYHHLVSQVNYWKNKHNDLVQAFKILSAYDIDIDYTELILRTREAARYIKELISHAEKIETDYPIILRYNDILFIEDTNHDPILDRTWSKLERKKLNFDTQYMFVDYLRDNKNRSQGKASAISTL